MVTSGRTWEPLGAQSGALGALSGSMVSSWISDRKKTLEKRWGAVQGGTGR